MGAKTGDRVVIAPPLEVGEIMKKFLKKTNYFNGYMQKPTRRHKA